MRALLTANVIYVFCLNVPEIALPLVLVTQMHASPAWSAAIFVANTVLVVTLQVPVTVLLSRFPRRSVLALSGVVLAASYLGFLAATSLGGGWGVPAVAVVSVVCTIGEIIYAGSATALAPHGSAAFWGGLAGATLLSASAVATEKNQRYESRIR